MENNENKPKIRLIEYAYYSIYLFLLKIKTFAPESSVSILFSGGQAFVIIIICNILNIKEINNYYVPISISLSLINLFYFGSKENLDKMIKRYEYETFKERLIHGIIVFIILIVTYILGIYYYIYHDL